MAFGFLPHKSCAFVYPSEGFDRPFMSRGSPFLPTWLSDDSDLWTLQDIPSSFIHLLRLASLHVTPEAKEVWLKVSWPSLASSSGDGAAPSRSALAQG